jgi:hypothetical protein
MLHINFANVERAISAIVIACAATFGRAVSAFAHLHSVLGSGHALRWFTTWDNTALVTKRAVPVVVTGASQRLQESMSCDLGLRLCHPRVPRSLR